MNRHKPWTAGLSALRGCRDLVVHRTHISHWSCPLLTHSAQLLWSKRAGQTKGGLLNSDQREWKVKAEVEAKERNLDCAQP
jgi:hypothetical protein